MQEWGPVMGVPQQQQEKFGRNDLAVHMRKILYIHRHRCIISSNSSGDEGCVDAVMHSSLLGHIIAGLFYMGVVVCLHYAIYSIGGCLVLAF